MQNIKKVVRAFSLLELLIAACIIFIFMGTFAIYADRTLKAAKDVALQNELGGIRMAIQHYLIINARLPQNLDELLKKNLTRVDPDGKVTTDCYLKAIRTGKDGSLLDPFLNKYSYNSINGLVRSETPGRTNW